MNATFLSARARTLILDVPQYIDDELFEAEHIAFIRCTYLLEHGKGVAAWSACDNSLGIFVWRFRAKPGSLSSDDQL